VEEEQEAEVIINTIHINSTNNITTTKDTKNHFIREFYLIKAMMEKILKEIIAVKLLVINPILRKIKEKRLKLKVLLLKGRKVLH